MADLGFIGYGIVGMATAYGLREGHDILWYDKFKDEQYVAKGLPRRGSPLEKVVDDSEFIFICLPTPTDFRLMQMDLSIIEDALGEIMPRIEGTDKIPILKSTVPPGTTVTYAENYENKNLCFNPEFLREATYLQDAENPDRIIIGALTNEVHRRVNVDVYNNGIPFPEAEIKLTDPSTAEMLKYANNAFLATKVMFANYMKPLCDELDIEWEEIRDYLYLDRRIGKSHLDVTSERGIGGKCFPKDIVGLIGAMRNAGVDPSFFELIWEKNLEIRKHYDWEEIPGATS